MGSEDEEEQFSEGEVGFYDPEDLSKDDASERVKGRYLRMVQFSSLMFRLGTDKKAKVSLIGISQTETCC